jgi:hypothetical protein
MHSGLTYLQQSDELLDRNDRITEPFSGIEVA